MPHDTAALQKGKQWDVFAAVHEDPLKKDKVAGEATLSVRRQRRYLLNRPS